MFIIPVWNILSSAAAGNNNYQIHCSIDSVVWAALHAYPNIMTNTSSDLETVDVSWITWVNCSFRMKAISAPPPKLGSDKWHNIIYMLQNNFKSSSTTRNWRKLTFYHVGITSACYVYQKIVILMIPHMNIWWFCTQILNFFMILHTNFGEWSLGGNDATPTHYYWHIKKYLLRR